MMEPYDTDWKKSLEKFKIVQKCPRCNELELRYSDGRIKCSNCGFEERIGEIK
ncbi:MAG: hypothetical protein AABX34_01840 [Nanoarchaeota archaeon]